MKILIVAHPNSRRERTEKDSLGNLHVYVHEQAIEGKANKAIIEALAKHFSVKKSSILLLSGEKSRNKVFQIT